MSALARITLAQFHGSSSAIPRMGCSTMRSRTWRRWASGSRPFRRAVPKSFDGCSRRILINRLSSRAGGAARTYATPAISPRRRYRCRAVAAAVAHDHGDFRVSCQPRFDAAELPIRQQLYGSAPLKVA